jgi:HSP20 family protein
MTQVRLNNFPAGRSFNNLMDDFFATVPSIIRDELVPSKQNVPVNIKETETDYQLEVVAPGFEKENFKVNLENKILTIEGEKKTEEENKSEKFVRREFRSQSFKRSFTIDDKIDTENISAKYVNGVLTLNLPKKGDVKPSTQQISIQ